MNRKVRQKHGSGLFSTRLSRVALSSKLQIIFELLIAEMLVSVKEITGFFKCGTFSFAICKQINCPTEQSNKYRFL